MMRLWGLLVVFAAWLSPLGHAFPTCGVDRQISSQIWKDERVCSTSGYCHQYGVNPDSGQYEYYYGYHYNCPGLETRTTTLLTCQRGDGTLYNKQESGIWGMCQIRR